MHLSLILNNCFKFTNWIAGIFSITFTFITSILFQISSLWSFHSCRQKLGCKKVPLWPKVPGGTPIQKGQGCLLHHLGGKVVLVSLRVFSLKRSTAGAFAIPLRVLGQNNMTGDNVLFWKPCPQSRILAPLWASLKISDEHPRPFYMGVSPGAKAIFRVFEFFDYAIFQGV